MFKFVQKCETKMNNLLVDLANIAYKDEICGPDAIEA